MKHIVIQIDVDGDSCEGCDLYQYSAYLNQSMCSVFGMRIDLDENENPQRLPECLAAEISIECGTCNYFGQNDCDTCHCDLAGFDGEQCRGDNSYKHWTPPTKGYER